MPGYSQGNRTLVSQQDAAVIENAQVPRSKFTNQWSRKTGFDAGYLVPILVDEILPGDHVSYSVTAYLRIATLLFPMFDSQRVDTHFFFVPNRLVWTDWVHFMGEQESPTDPPPSAYSVPQIVVAVDNSVNSIYDHYGVPGADGALLAPLSINALPFRMYNLIWNTWFRDQNLSQPALRLTGSGPDPSGSYVLKKRAKSHDYFTSALPWPQKFTAPTVPLGGLAPVSGFGVLGSGSTASPANYFDTASGGVSRSYARVVVPGQTLQAPGAGPAPEFGMEVDATTRLPKVYADLSQSTGIAINTLRQAWLVQQLLERDARGGTRYVELIRSHFGVTNPDFRLQRPEYIGGGQSPLNITPIAQTAPTTDQPLGALGAAGTSGGTHRASYAATEHGFVIGLLSVKTELSYQQGLPKMFSRTSRYDYYWPSLAGLGEQAILRREIYAKGDAADANVFGYQERWQEYRTRSSEVTGIMRSGVPGTLDGWHLAQVFTTQPLLNESFILEDPPMQRVFAAADLQTNMQYLADILYHRVRVAPIPTYGTPVTLGRF